MIIIDDKDAAIAQSNTLFIVTHDGVFHADDVFSAALLAKLGEWLGKNIFIHRTRNITDALKESADIIFDVGYGKFDHHQKDKRIRENGIPYAAFGLLWEIYGRSYIKYYSARNDLSNVNDDNIDDVWKYVDTQFVEHIDAADNGIEHEHTSMSISSMIHLFNPNWDEGDDFSRKFIDAVDIADGVLERVVGNAISKIAAKEAVIAAIQNRKDERVVILDRYMPWQEYLLQEESANGILYVIYPSISGAYNVQAVPDAPNSTGMRKPLPESWVQDMSIAYETSGGKISFIHPARFLCGCPTLEDAITIAEYAAY